MTRLASTGWAAALLGLGFTGSALAQSTPTDETPTTTTTTGRDGTTTTTTTPDGTVTPDTTNTPPANPPPAPPTPAPMTNSDATRPADVDVNVHTPAPVVTTTPQPTYVEPVHNTLVVHEDAGPMSGIGIEIAAGGGASGFVNDTLRNTTNVGGDWDVRATIGTRSPIAFEGSYIGSAQSINALGLDSNAMLVGNGVQGALRLNATLDLPVQPFVYGGAAWRRYDLTNTNQNLSDIRGKDDVLEIPLGIGIAGRFSGVMLDARGEYRVAREADLVPTATGSNDFAAMNRWGVKATAGVEF